MTGPTLTGLDLVRDQLHEARRYTHVKPRDAEVLLHLALMTLFHVPVRPKDDRLISRVRGNLAVGGACMAAAPDVTAAAITLSLWELGDLASRLRKDAEAEGRDRELMEGYGPKGGGESDAGT